MAAKRRVVQPWGPVWLRVIALALGLAYPSAILLDEPLVIWSHMHDSYQSAFGYFLVRHVPAMGWTFMQGTTLLYELLGPLLFPPVMWFSALMISVLLAGYAPLHWLT